MYKTKIISTAVIVAAVVSILAGQQVYAIKSTHYEIGYNDGCNHTLVPGKHTAAYLSGYAAGARACGGSRSLDNSQNLGQASTVNPTCRLLCAGSSSQAQAGTR